MTDKITIRPMVPLDLNFILSTWLKSYKYSSDMVRRMRDEEYFKTYEPMLKEIIANSSPLIACLTAESDVILGYMIRQYQAEANCIHYCFVKESWRKLGIFKMLLKAADFQGKVYFSHWTAPVNSLTNKYPDFIYNPYRLGV